MRLLIPSSLKVTVPLLLVVFAAVLTVVSIMYSIPRAQQDIEEKTRELLFQKLSRLQSSLEYLLLKGDLLGAQREIAVLASQPDHGTVLLLDDNHRIIAATRRAWFGRQITEVLASFDVNQAEKAANQRRTLVLLASDGDSLFGYAGVNLGMKGEALRPMRIGHLLFEQDLSGAKAITRAQILNQSLYWSGFVTVLALVLWLVFHFMLTRRVERLAKTAERLAQGDMSARSRLVGKDELARLSHAFDAMAEQVDFSQTRLKHDITERERVEQALRESEARLQQILNNTTSVVYVMNAAERFILINRQFEKLFHLEQKDIIGKTISDLFPKETAEEFRRNNQLVLERNMPIEFEETAPLDDGMHTYISIKFPLYNAEQRSYAVCGISTDITERKRSELALVQKQRFQDIVTTISTHFINLPPEKVDEGINHALALVGRHTKVDRSYVFIFAQDEASMSNTHEWCQARISPQIEKLKNIPINEVAWIVDPLKRGEHVHVPSVKDMPEQAVTERIHLEAQDIQSLVCVPLVITGEAIGLVGFDVVRETRYWSDDDISLLRTVAEIFANALERKRADEALRVSEESYRAIFDATEDAIFIHDIDSGAIVDVNPKACLTYGYSCEEMKRINVEALGSGRHPYTQEEAIKRMEKAKAGKPQRFEWHRRNKDGSLHWDEVFLKRAAIAGKDRFLAFTREITERKEAEQALRASEEQYRSMFNTSIDGLALWNAEGRIVDINPALWQMHHYNREEFFQLSPRNVIHPDYHHVFDEFLHSVSIGKPFHVEVQDICKDGGVLELEVHGIPMKYQSKPHVLTIARDITERKQAEAALRTSEEQYRVIFNAATDGFGVWRPDGTLVDVNPAMCRMHGFDDREEFLHAEPQSYIHPDSQPLFGVFLESVMTGELFQCEAQDVKKNGEVFDVEVHGISVSYQGEPHLLSIVRDVTERKQAEQQRRQLEAQLRQAQKMEAIGHLTGGIAHDFNNILTSIMGYTVLGIERQEEIADPKLQKYLQQIQRSGERARDLIQQMLTFSRGQRGESRPLSMPPLVKETVKLLRSTLPSSVEFRTDIKTDIPIVRLDPVQVEQVLMNLCINARDAMDSRGTITIKLKDVEVADDICTACRQSVHGLFLELVIQDTGRGIAPEVVDRMFEPFFTTKEVGKGSGMGLSTVHGIVHDHGGHIVVRTTPEEGTAFKVLFPALTDLERVEDSESAHAKATARDLGIKAHIMVVDDEASVAEFMGDLLESRGLTVTVKTSPVEALELFYVDPHVFDIVVTDQTMPKMTGTELAHELLKKRRELPIILYTGHGEDMDEEQLKDLGIQAYIKKPVELETLFALISKLRHHREEKPVTS